MIRKTLGLNLQTEGCSNYKNFVHLLCEDQLVYPSLRLLKKKLSINVGTVAFFIPYVTIDAGGVPEIYKAIILWFSVLPVRKRCPF